MSVTVLNSQFQPMAPLASTPREASGQASTAPSDAWRAAFEQAAGGSFQSWFQAPTDRQSLDIFGHPGTGNGASVDTETASRAALPTAGPWPSPAVGAQDDRVGGEAAPDATTTRAAAPVQTPTRDAPTRRSAASDGMQAADAAVQMQVQRQTALSPDGASLDLVAAPSIGGSSAIFSGSVGEQAGGAASPMSALLASALVQWAQVPVAVAAGPGDVLRASTSISSGAQVADDPADVAGSDGDPVDDAAPAVRSGDAGRATAAEREPLRVHAEWSDAGVRVWLGSDAQNAPDIGALTQQLQQWLGGQGTRLLGLVCNGRDVWTAPTSPVSRMISNSARRGDSAPDPLTLSSFYSNETP